MFDLQEFVAAGPSGVAEWARVENAACARRLVAMTIMLDKAYAASGSADRERWYVDNWAAVSAQIGAAQHITRGAASHHLLIAVALRDQLPRLNDAFLDGLVAYWTVIAIAKHTRLIKDPCARAKVDAAITQLITTSAPLSKDALTAEVDNLVEQHDPHAVYRIQLRARTRDIGFDHGPDSGAGFSSLWATVFTSDAELFESRLDALQDTVCPNDPRTTDQRRADAIGVIGAADRLPCLCGRDDCTATTNAPAATGGTTVHVVVNDDTLDTDTPEAAEQDTALDGESPPLFDRPLRELTLNEALAPPPVEDSATRPAAVIGAGVVPGAVARRIAATANRTRRIVHPRQSLPEKRYRPSVPLAEFVRCRDMTCRFPGCTVSAFDCDLDHTVAYPRGPTCASNLKALCRHHHLLKTHYGGTGGWRDRQEPDGTVVWTDPDGKSHTTYPGSRTMFPALCEPTAPAVIDTNQPLTSSTGLMMPKRARTRAEDRRKRIDDERELNRTDPQRPPPEPDDCPF